MVDDVLTLARERFDRAYEFDRENQQDMLEDLEFKVGEQWPNQIKNERETEGRPCLTINRMPQFINQVVNDIRLNSPSIKVVGTEDADTKIAEIYTGLIRSIEARSDASIAYEGAAEGAASCGIGHFRITTEYSDEGGDPDTAFDLDIKIKRIADSTGVMYDPDAEEFTKEDGKYVFVPRDITQAEFKKAWPDASVDPFQMEHVSNTQAGWYSETDKIRITEYWTKDVTVDHTVALLDSGEVVKLDKETRKAIKAAGLKIVKKREVTKTTVMFHMMSGSEILEGPVEFPSNFIPIVPVIGDETHIGEKVVRSGLIRPAKDPQRMYNYWRSASTEAIALAPKAPWLLTVEQVKGSEDQWAVSNRQNLPYLTYRPDPQAPPPSRTAPANPPMGMLQETASAADDMKAVTGIYDSSLGQSSREKSGKAILARERQSDVGTFQYADNLRRAMSYAGKILVDMIPRIYDTERTIRILGEDDSEEFVILNQQDDDGNILNDLSQGKYEINVKTGPSFTTQREEARESMMAYVAANPNAGVVAGDLIAKTMDWPGADELAKRLKKMVPPGMIEEDEEDREIGPDGQPIPTPEEQAQQQQQQRQQQLDEMQMAKLQAEIKKAEADAEKSQAEANKTKAEVMVIARTAGQGGGMEQEQQEVARINMQLEVKREALELEKMKAETEGDQAEASVELEIKQVEKEIKKMDLLLKHKELTQVKE